MKTKVMHDQIVHTKRYTIIFKTGTDVNYFYIAGLNMRIPLHELERLIDKFILNGEKL